MEPQRYRSPGAAPILARLVQLALIGLVGLFALLLTVTLVPLWWPPRTAYDPDAEPRPVAARGGLFLEEEQTIALFEESAPSVVHISTQGAGRIGGLFGADTQRGMVSTGSGIVWDERGHIVTNHHVVQGATHCTVSLVGGDTWRAAVIGVAPEQDLAVLRILAPPSRLRPIPIGTSADLRVGQRVLAIGNPFGLDRTLSTGVISGLDRVISARRGPRIGGVIQTDAAIHPGNSGGPLLDSAGRLIGINTAIASETGAFSGIGFAVPVDVVNRIVPQLLRTGRVPRAGLGVQLADAEVGQSLGHEGALILGLMEGLAAEKAGLLPYRRRADGSYRTGDRIVALDGQPIGGNWDLQRRLAERVVGDEVLLEVLRGEQRREVRVRLEPID